MCVSHDGGDDVYASVNNNDITSFLLGLTQSLNISNIDAVGSLDWQSEDARPDTVGQAAQSA